MCRKCAIIFDIVTQGHTRISSALSREEQEQLGRYFERYNTIRQKLQCVVQPTPDAPEGMLDLSQSNSSRERLKLVE